MQKLRGIVSRETRRLLVASFATMNSARIGDAFLDMDVNAYRECLQLLGKEGTQEVFGRLDHETQVTVMGTIGAHKRDLLLQKLSDLELKNLETEMPRNRYPSRWGQESHCHAVSQHIQDVSLKRIMLEWESERHRLLSIIENKEKKQKSLSLGHSHESLMKMRLLRTSSTGEKLAHAQEISSRLECKRLTAESQRRESRKREMEKYRARFIEPKDWVQEKKKTDGTLSSSGSSDEWNELRAELGLSETPKTHVSENGSSNGSRRRKNRRRHPYGEEL